MVESFEAAVRIRARAGRLRIIQYNTHEEMMALTKVQLGIYIRHHGTCIRSNKGYKRTNRLYRPQPTEPACAIGLELLKEARQGREGG